MATFTPCVFEHHKREDGKYRVSFRITQNRKSVYLKTEVYVVKQQLTRDFKIKDPFLIKSMAEKADVYQNMVIRKFGISLDGCSAVKIKEFLERESNRTDDDIDFVVFSKGYIARMKEEGRASTASPIEKSLNALIDFYGSDKVCFKDVTRDLLERFGRYLKNEREVVRLNQNGKEYVLTLKPLDDFGVGKYYVDLRSLFYAGVKQYNDDDSDDVVIKHNPFRQLEIKVKRSTLKRNISVDLIRRVFHMEDSELKRVNFARDMFILSFLLVGMNMADLYEVDEYKDGRISYRRKKTLNRREDEAFISIKVEPEAVDLIEKYRDCSGVRVFDFYRRYSTSHIFDSNVNKGLKKVQEVCGIADCLTTYVARHSWATIARNKLNVQTDDIALCLNHVNEGHRVTDIYIEKDFSRIDVANRRMIDLLNEK